MLNGCVCKFALGLYFKISVFLINIIIKIRCLSYVKDNMIRFKLFKCKSKLLLITFIAINLVDEPTPEVKIEQGILIGKTNRDGSIFQYLGIPYATANSSTRFRAPGPPPSWTGIHKAVDETSSCPQNSIFGIIGTEDCLKVNVYVPSMMKRPLPVLVYIHGGAFVMGSGGKLIYGPDYLVEKGVILATFNYRIGILGFLCLRIKEAPGNAGIKDQIAALRWIKKNIAAFGGDPENITIFGESAGATSASLLLISKSTTGLFKKAIIQSGTSVSSWSINRNPLWVASLLAKSAGYSTKDPAELYNIFSKMTYQELTSLSAKKPLGLFFDTQLLHLPCVEYNIPGVEPIITDLPFNMFKNNSKNIDVIYGTTSREGFLLIAEDNNETLSARDGRYLFASDLRFSSDEEGFLVSKEVEKYYFGKDKINMKHILKVSEFYTNLYFEVPAIFESECLLKNTHSKVYNYIFNYSGQRNYMKLRSGYNNEPGASHADDIFYLFSGTLLPPVFTREDKKMVNYMTTLWTNFAKYGNPTPSSKNFEMKWIPSTKENMKFLYIDSVLKMGTMPNYESYRLWKDIYDKYRKTHID